MASTALSMGSIDVPDDLECRICTSLLCEPHQLGCCADLYCRRCIDSWLATKPECPVCQKTANVSEPVLQSSPLHSRIAAFAADSKTCSSCGWTGDATALHRCSQLVAITIPEKDDTGAEEDNDSDVSQRAMRSADSSDDEDLRTSAYSRGGPAPSPPPLLRRFSPSPTPATSFVGLSNQGATCYLNSLLQTLFMTPEFRNALYRWDSSSVKHEDKSIPYQLQRLFGMLQTSVGESYRAISTTPLTKSFGWERAEAFEQHDVQELCRILFDKLDRRLRTPEDESLIDSLYQGELKDYVKCLECEHESARHDKFLDISLVIRAFGATEAVKSLEEALTNFEKSETLDGDNQYHCARCDAKVDAKKGLKFTKFPYLLTIQLKRFDFDYQTMRRIKLHDRVSFPTVLDLSKFNAENNGEYELFSIMVHSGSALGGHYFAYIKNFDDGKWYNFNDSLVSEISELDIERTFGSASSYTYNSTSAYMLMYRRRSDQNERFLTEEHLPEHLRALLDAEAVRERERQERAEIARNTWRFEVYADDPRDPIKRESVDIELHNAEPVSKLLAEAHRRLGADAFAALEDCRLRMYDSYFDEVRDALSDPSASLRSLFRRADDFEQFLLETRPPGGEFPEYETPSTFFMCFAIQDGEVNPHGRITVGKSETVRDVMAKLAPVLRASPEDVRIAHSRNSNTPQMLQPSDRSFLTSVYAPVILFAFAVNQKQDIEVACVTEMEDEEDECALDSSTLRVPGGAASSDDDDEEDDEDEESDALDLIDGFINTIKRTLMVPPTAKSSAPQRLEISVNRRWRVERLKEFVCDKLGATVREFKLKRGAYEPRLDDTVSFAFPDNEIEVVFERALVRGEYLVELFFFDPTAFGKDNLEHPVFTPLGSAIFAAGQTFAEIKGSVVLPLLHEHGYDFPLECLRLREKSFSSVQQIVHDDMVAFTDIRLYPLKSFCVQQLDAPEGHDPDVHAVYFCQFHPSRLEYGAIHEVFVPCKDRGVVCTEKIIELSGVPAEHLRFHRTPMMLAAPTRPRDLVTSKSFYDRLDIYYLSEGQLFIFKDDREEAPDLGDDKADDDDKTDATTQRTRRTATSYSYWKEKTLQIADYKEDEDEDEELAVQDSNRSLEEQSTDEIDI